MAPTTPSLFAGVLCAVAVLSTTYLYLKDLSHASSISKLGDQIDTLRATHADSLAVATSQRANLEQQLKAQQRQMQQQQQRLMRRQLMLLQTQRF